MIFGRAGVEADSVACSSALIGASNFFKLVGVTAINLFGFDSGAALATVVGVLIGQAAAAYCAWLAGHSSL